MNQILKVKYKLSAFYYFACIKNLIEYSHLIFEAFIVYMNIRFGIWV